VNVVRIGERIVSSTATAETGGSEHRNRVGVSRRTVAGTASRSARILKGVVSLRNSKESSRLRNLGSLDGNAKRQWYQSVQLLVETPSDRAVMIVASTSLSLSLSRVCPSRSREYPLSPSLYLSSLLLMSSRAVTKIWVSR
jgi:hypothetical protein